MLIHDSEENIEEPIQNGLLSLTTLELKRYLKNKKGNICMDFYVCHSSISGFLSEYTLLSYRVQNIYQCE